jgi:hypothetical protein
VAPVALTLLLAGPVAVAQTPPPDYTVMIVKVGKQAVEATLGTYCHPQADGTGKCGQADYPLKGTGKVTLYQNGTVKLLLRAQASRVAWRAARIDGTGKERIVAVGEAKPLLKTHRQWQMKLPKNLSRTTDLLGWDVNYPYAYSSFEVGAKVRKAKPKKKK